jgi:hypothetical protein
MHLNISYRYTLKLSIDVLFLICHYKCTSSQFNIVCGVAEEALARTIEGGGGVTASDVEGSVDGRADRLQSRDKTSPLSY